MFNLAPLLPIQYTCTESTTGFTLHMYRGSIRAIEFSECGEFLATVDTDRCVSVFRSVQSRNIHKVQRLFRSTLLI